MFSSRFPVYSAMIVLVVCMAQMISCADHPAKEKGLEEPKGPFTCPGGSGWACWADVRQRNEICDSRGWNNRWSQDHWLLGTCHCCKA